MCERKASLGFLEGAEAFSLHDAERWLRRDGFLFPNQMNPEHMHVKEKDRPCRDGWKGK